MIRLQDADIGTVQVTFAQHATTTAVTQTTATETETATATATTIDLVVVEPRLTKRIIKAEILFLVQALVASLAMSFSLASVQQQAC